MNCNIDCLSNTLIETVDENVENILSLNIKLSDIGVETVNGISVLGGNLSFRMHTIQIIKLILKAVPKPAKIMILH